MGLAIRRMGGKVDEEEVPRLAAGLTATVS